MQQRGKTSRQVRRGSAQAEVISRGEANVAFTLAWEAFDAGSVRVAQGLVPDQPLTLSAGSRTRCEIKLPPTSQAAARTLKVKAVAGGGEVLSIGTYNLR